MKGWVRDTEYSIRRGDVVISKAICGNVAKYTVWISGKRQPGFYLSEQEAAESVK